MCDQSKLDIKTKRLVLRLFEAADADEVFENITEQLTKFMSWEPPASRNAFAVIWRQWQISNADGTDMHFVIRSADADRFLGLAGLHAVRTDSPELGIWVREDCHGLGIGREAVHAVARWASRELILKRLVYPVAEQNIASRKIAESLGGEIVSRQNLRKYNSVTYHIPVGERTEL